MFWIVFYHLYSLSNKGTKEGTRGIEDPLRFDPSTFLRISRTPLDRDQYENETVRVGPSNIPFAGEGLFAIRHLGMDPRIHCNENPVYVFLSWELRGLSPNFYIHVSRSDLYIPRIGACSKIDRLILEIFKSLSDISV
jgi:hypothetical protein